ncbi:DsbA family protein [Fluviispira vulneris]|uniref:DsbA family protein n=1 Tax=Fluviispira vulneris TaxID=2763012 RepID=UPI001646BC1B|nr:DsbA family protein [Fluviispira vulneris]
MNIDDKWSSSMSPLRSVGFIVGGIVLGSLLTAGIMISKYNKKAVDVSDAVGQPLFIVDGKTWNTSELPGDSRMEYFDLENNIFNARQAIASKTALRLALSKDLGKPITPENIAKIEDLLPLQSVTEIDARTFYDQNVAKWGLSFFGGKSYEEIKDQLLQQMKHEKARELLATKIKEFEDSGRIKVLLKAPTAPPVKLNLSGFPVRGNANSSKVLVVVADYLCTHCRESEEALEKIYQEFSNKVKFVHVSYPLAPQGLSGALARGAYCATEQGEKEFWDYQKAAFAIPFAKMQPPSLMEPEKAFNLETIELAKSVKLNVEKFSTCLESENARKYIDIVRNQFNENVGFSGTPAFYLNGSLIQVSPQKLAATLKLALN